MGIFNFPRANIIRGSANIVVRPEVANILQKLDAQYSPNTLQNQIPELSTENDNLVTNLVTAVTNEYEVRLLSKTNIFVMGGEETSVYVFNRVNLKTTTLQKTSGEPNDKIQYLVRKGIYGSHTVGKLCRLVTELSRSTPSLLCVQSLDNASWWKSRSRDYGCRAKVTVLEDSNCVY